MAANKKAIAKKPVKKAAVTAKKPVVKQNTKKVATKPIAKKAVVKKATPKPAAKKPAIKKATTNPVIKKVASKKVESKKPIAKKATPKPAAKKPAAKVVAKAPAKKAVVKKVAVKEVAKKAAVKKPMAKKAEVKKPIAKKVEVKKTTTKEIEKKIKAKPEKVVVEKPVKEPKVPKVKKAGKSTVKTIFSPTTPILPKKSDVFKPTASTIPTLKNDSGKVIAHRKTEDMKRKPTEDLSHTMVEYVPEYNKSILDATTEDVGPRYRYSDEDLVEFRELIAKKLETARNELHYLQGLITRKDEAGTEDTENKFAGMEEGSESHDREQLNQLASRQIKFIGNLEQAMIRVENKTYGICRVTGKLIDKARLRAVPHATLSIDAKMAMNK